MNQGFAADSCNKTVAVGRRCNAKGSSECRLHPTLPRSHRHQTHLRCAKVRRPLLISHDFSYSGAPIALLSLAKSLKRLGENPMVVALRAGPLRNHFRESGIEVAEKVDPAGVEFVIANTVVSIPAALQFKKFGIPIAAWVHESMYFFQTLKISPDEVRFKDLDVFLAPSSFQIEEFAPFLSRTTAYQLRNAVEQDWFRPPDDESSFAVSGQWEKRKGQADLLRLAQDSKCNCRFKFIGAHRPERYPDISLGLQHKFLGPVRPEDARLEIAKSDAIISCAEAEVQPLSAIEASMAGRPALLSDIPAHRVLSQLIPNVFLFDRSSHRSFSEGLVKLIDAIPDEGLAMKASRTAKALFGEACLDQRLRDIVKIIRERKTSAARISFLQDA